MSVADIKSQMLCHFQTIAEDIARGLNKGLFKLIRNLAVRMLWNEYDMPESVAMGTFMTAIEEFLTQQLHMSAAEVDSVLSEDNRVAIASALDRDGDGKVQHHDPVTEFHVRAVLAALTAVLAVVFRPSDDPCWGPGVHCGGERRVSRGVASPR